MYGYYLTFTPNSCIPTPAANTWDVFVVFCAIRVKEQDKIVPRKEEEKKHKRSAYSLKGKTVWEIDNVICVQKNGFCLMV